jgi:CBS domain-containing protein
MTGERQANEPINHTPLFFNLFREIEAAQSIDTLRTLGVKMLELVRVASRPGADLKNLVPQISRLNDAVTLRLIALLESTEGIRLPEGATYLALGSEGRGDQTLRTDQDSAIVFADDLPADKLPDIDRFATRLVDALEEIGVPRCTGNMMASNPQWRHSLSEWKRRLDQWINVPTPDHVLDFGIFQGLRALHGDKTLEKQLHDHIRAAIRRPSLFFPHMARHALRFPPPLTIFGRIRVERSGEHRGKVDIKKAGIFAITVGANLLALEAGFIGGNTWEKLELLRQRGVLARGDLETIEEAFTFLVQFRLQWQLRELAANGKLTNHVDPLAMTDNERYQFRQALKGVNAFLRIMNNRYQLNFISR